jgi:hypothetical protein
MYNQYDKSKIRDLGVRPELEQRKHLYELERNDSILHDGWTEVNTQAANHIRKWNVLNTARGFSTVENC